MSSMLLSYYFDTTSSHQPLEHAVIQGVLDGHTDVRIASFDGRHTAATFTGDDAIQQRLNQQIIGLVTMGNRDGMRVQVAYCHGPSGCWHVTVDTQAAHLSVSDVSDLEMRHIRQCKFLTELTGSSCQYGTCSRSFRIDQDRSGSFRIAHFISEVKDFLLRKLHATTDE